MAKDLDPLALEALTVTPNRFESRLRVLHPNEAGHDGRSLDGRARTIDMPKVRSEAIGTGDLNGAARPAGYGFHAPTHEFGVGVGLVEHIVGAERQRDGVAHKITEG